MTVTCRALILLICILSFISCHEAYFPDELDAQDKILVVEGYIDDGPGPFQVKLSRASVFNETSYDEVKNASVTISDNLGNNELLKEHNDGRYLSTSGKIMGIHASY